VHRDGLLTPRVQARKGSGAGGGGRGEYASQAEKGWDARETDAAFHHRVGMSRADFTRLCPRPFQTLFLSSIARDGRCVPILCE